MTNLSGSQYARGGLPNPPPSAGLSNPAGAHCDVLDLDDVERFRALDPDGMLGHIAGLPAQCQRAWERVSEVELPSDYADVRAVVITGMGGSAIGGDLVRTLVLRECAIPVVVSRGYHLPAFVGPDTLLVGSSYSGNTEETLAAFAEGLARGAKGLAITSGGRLAEIADGQSLPLIHIDYQAQPRAALAHSFIPLVGVLTRLGLIADKGAQLTEAVQVMGAVQAEIGPTVPTQENAAKRLAQRLHGHLPLVYGAEHLSEVGRRWKGQFNENGKAWAAYEVMPEANHNAVVGYENPPAMATMAFVVLLTSELYHSKVQARYRVTREILADRGVSCQEVAAQGASPLAQMLSSIHFGDYVSYYLAMLYEIDPTPVETIVYLKRRLAKSN